MKKKPVKRKVVTSAKVSNKLFEKEIERVRNGALSEAILGYDPNAPWANTVQLSQVDTLVKNNRWYLISNMRQVLNEIYVEHGIIQTLVDVPVDDALRGGVDVVSQQLTPEEIQKLVGEMEREGDLIHLAEGAKWNRLFGGGGVVILTGQDPSTPLDIASIKPGDPLEFRGVDMWELFWDLQNTEGFDVGLNLQTQNEFDYYSYYGINLHKSRVMRMKGITAPSFIRPRLRGWGLSIVETLVRSINQYLKSTDLVFEVLDEFKIDVYKIKNLANTLLTQNGAQKVRQRVQLANLEKNYQNAITMDSEDDYMQKELSFTGLAEVMEGIKKQIASDMRFPLTKLFGISAQGFSSGQEDLENYNSMVESQVREKIKFYVINICELRCQQLFGFVPTDLTVKFKPLRILTAEQEENVKTQKFARLQAALQIGAISPEEFKEACNKEDLLGIQLDATDNSLNVSTDTNDDSEEDKQQDTGGPADGANAPSSAKIAPLKAKGKESTLDAPEAKA